MSEWLNRIESKINKSTFENFILEHSPESSISGLTMETRGIDWFFSQEEIRENPEHFFVLLAGSSESGKSHFGDHFVKSETGNRLKFYKLLRLTPGYNEWVASGVKNPDPFKYASYLEDKPEERDEAFSVVMDQIHEIEEETRCTISSFETIKHPWINEYFGRIDNALSINIFIDAPLESRVVREAAKTGKDIDLVRADTLKKDSEKKDYGNEGVLKVSNIIVNNGGSLEEYDQFITLFEERCRAFADNSTAIPIDNADRETGQLFFRKIDGSEAERELRKKYGFIMLKPDTIERGLEDIIQDYIVAELKKKGIYIIGASVIPPMSKDDVGRIYPEIEPEYLEAYIKIYGSDSTVVMFAEAKDQAQDIWEVLHALRGKSTVGNGLRDSIRAILPLPGERERFEYLSDRARRGELTEEEYIEISKSLIHVPDNLAEFAGVLNAVPEKDKEEILGKKRAINLNNLVLPHLKNRI